MPLLVQGVLTRRVFALISHQMRPDCSIACALSLHRRPSGFQVPISLRTCYAMSGTDLAYGAICLRACYAVSGTDVGDGATCLRACYAMSGTDLKRMVLPESFKRSASGQSTMRLCVSATRPAVMTSCTVLHMRLRLWYQFVRY
eukprot:2305774-Rhodomonas_salina.7